MDEQTYPVVVLTRRAEKDLRQLDAVDRRRALQILLAGELQSRHVKHLSGYRTYRRRRVGPLRIVFRPPLEDEHHVHADFIVISVRRRQEAYSALRGERAVPRVSSLPALGGDTIYEAVLGRDEVEEEFEEGADALESGAYVLELDLSNPDAASADFDADSHRRHVVLTREQHQILHHLRTSQDAVRVYEGAPGTAKSVLATSRARDFLTNNSNAWAGIIAPQTLVDNLYGKIKPLSAFSDDRLFVGTLRSWLDKFMPALAHRIAATSGVIELLRNCVPAATRAGLTEKHLIAYQGYVLSEVSAKDLVAADPDLQLEILRRARAQFEKQRQRLQRKQAGEQPDLLRIEAARAWRDAPPAPPESIQSALLIVDEAQDLFKEELTALDETAKAWRRRGVDAYLMLLGDTNQRVYPTGFDWGALPYPRQQLQQNYRNSRRVLEFATQVHGELLKLAGASNSRHPPEPARPEHAVEDGERVRLLVTRDEAEAEHVLQALSPKSNTRGKPARLLDELADAVKVLCPAGMERSSAPGALYLPIGQAKGHEYEACVMYRMFNAEAFRSATGLQACYTAITRARTRLLIIATESEVQEMEQRALLGSVDRTTASQEAIAWIRQFKTGVALDDLIHAPERLLGAVQEGTPYVDTFDVLERVGADVARWEEAALEHLRNAGADPMSILHHYDDPRMRVLLLRAAGCSWAAVEAAERIHETGTSRRSKASVLASIAEDLRARGLPLDAARVLWRAGVPEPHTNDCVSALAEVDGPIAAAVAKWGLANLKSFEEAER